MIRHAIVLPAGAHIARTPVAARPLRRDAGRRPYARGVGNHAGSGSAHAFHQIPLHPSVQPKLEVGAPDDRFEREAERIAERVVNTPEAGPDRVVAGEAAGSAHRVGDAAGRATRAREPGGGGGGPALDLPPLVDGAVRSPGEPLEPSTRAFMERRFGYDFGGVRVHANAMAAASARAMHALAYTVGRDVVFAEGQYRPESETGRRLLAHELAHVVQQGAARRVPRSQPPGASGGGASAADGLGRVDPTSGPALQRRLTFTDRSLGDAVDRFIALVNRLLPYGWEFTLSPRPRVDMSGNLPVFGAGEARLTSVDPFGTLEEQSQAWQRRFRDALARLIASSETSSFALATGRSFFVGSFRHGEIDVADLERLPPPAAATLLIHELDEALGLRRDLQAVDREFDARHILAIVGEAEVMGGERLEDDALTRPRGIDPRVPPEDRAWEYWVPFRMRDGSIRALVARFNGHTFVGGRMAGFASLERFREGVPN
ncbi:MAG TPA: DUF4157 domain-containing protein [Longimicrobiales bacterium]